MAATTKPALLDNKPEYENGVKPKIIREHVKRMNSQPRLVPARFQVI